MRAGPDSPVAPGWRLDQVTIALGLHDTQLGCFDLVAICRPAGAGPAAGGDSQHSCGL